VAAWLVAIFGPPVVATAFIPLRGDMASANIVLVLALVVVVAALLGGPGPGAVAAVVAALAFDVLNTRPYYSLTIDRAKDVETTVLLLIVGLTIGQLVTRARRFRAAASTARAELQRVQRLVELAAGGERPERLISIVQNELVQLLDVDDCEFERAPFVDALPRLAHTGVSVPVALPRVAGGEPEGRIELPVWGEGLEIGRFVLTLRSRAPGTGIPPAARAAAVALADQLGVILLAHER
jgi:hypothetical protein